MFKAILGNNITLYHKEYLYVKLLYLLLIILLIILMVFYIDLDVLDTPLLAEAPPKFSFFYILRTTLIASSSFFIIIFAVNFCPSNKTRNAQDGFSEIWENWGVVVWTKDASMEKEIISIRVKKLIVLANLMLSLFYGVFSQEG